MTPTKVRRHALSSLEFYVILVATLTPHILHLLRLDLWLGGLAFPRDISEGAILLCAGTYPPTTYTRTRCFQKRGIPCVRFPSHPEFGRLLGPDTTHALNFLFIWGAVL